MLNFVRTADFDFELPQELIAQHPAEPRDSARLMVLRRASQTIEHHHVRNLPDLLAPGSLMVVNDTRVMAARLLAAAPKPVAPSRSSSSVPSPTDDGK